MEIHQIISKAQNTLDTAEYLLLQTYPKIKEPKMLFTIVVHILNSMDDSTTALLEFARYKGVIMPYHNSLLAKVNVMQRKLNEIYRIEKKYAVRILEINEVVQSKKDASTEFQRKGRLVFADDNFSLNDLSYDKVKKYFETARDFLKKIKEIIGYELLDMGGKK